MTVGVIDPDPMTGQVLLEIQDDVRVEGCQFPADDGSPKMQFKTLLKVLAGAGERDGELLTQYFSFSADGKIGPKTKTGQMLDVALEGNTKAESLEELAERLPGKRFVAELVASKNGMYSNVEHDTIRLPRQKPPEPEPAKPEPNTGNGGPKPAAQKAPEPEPPEDDFEDIPF